MAKILVVDDEPDMIWAITNVLLSENHSVVSVNSGEEAILKVKDVPLDLVLLDFRLPGMDGVQILEKIKQIKPDLPVIMVTGYGGIEEAVQAIKLGASHYISKPFDNNHLVETVNQSLQLNALKKEGVFGKRLAEKISPRAVPPTPAGNGGTEPRPAPFFFAAKKGGRSRWLERTLVVLLVALGVSGGAWWHRTRLQGSVQRHAISHSHVSGLSWGDDMLWACDWFSESVYQYKLDRDRLILTKTYRLPGVHLTGIAWSGEFLYTCDSWKRTINKHALNQTLSVVASAPSPGTNPSGIHFDGTHLWSCDGNTRKLYKHAVDEKLTVLASYDSQSPLPVGMHADGGGLWYLGVKGRVYKHRLDPGFGLEGIFILPKKDGEQNLQVSAFTIREGEYWLAYEGVAEVQKRHLSSLKPTSH